MKVHVLGCSGGINRDAVTRFFLLDDNILIDAGTGVSALTLDEMRPVRYISAVKIKFISKYLRK